MDQKVEPNHGLVFAEETFMTIRRDGELIAIEHQNGKIERYVTMRAGAAESANVFGTRKASKQV